MEKADIVTWRSDALAQRHRQHWRLGLANFRLQNNISALPGRRWEEESTLHTSTSEAFFASRKTVNSDALGPGPRKEWYYYLQGRCAATSHKAVYHSLILYKYTLFPEHRPKGHPTSKKTPVMRFNRDAVNLSQRQTLYHIDFLQKLCVCVCVFVSIYLRVCVCVTVINPPHPTPPSPPPAAHPSPQSPLLFPRIAILQQGAHSSLWACVFFLWTSQKETGAPSPFLQARLACPFGFSGLCL